MITISNGSKFTIRTSYWEDYKVMSIHMNNCNASCRLSIYHEEPGIAVISDLYVDQDERGKGLGNELLDECISIAEDYECKSVKLYSDTSWKKNWYVRHGFTVMYSCGSHVMLMKNLRLDDKAKAPTLIGQDYSEGRCGYKIPAGYEFDSIRNDEIILKPKVYNEVKSTDLNTEHY